MKSYLCMKSIWSKVKSAACRSFWGALLLAGQSLFATAGYYVNDAIVQAPPMVPPQIDATNFINHNVFIINFTNGEPTFYGANLPPYQMANTINYTNSSGAQMSFNSGWDAEAFFPQAGQLKRASSFFNAGTIDVGTITTSNLFTINNFFFGSFSGAKLLISATNVANPGTINMGFESLLSIKGGSVDLSRSTVTKARVSISLTGRSSLIPAFWTGTGGSEQTS
jgi:hypothetical protein